MLANLGKSFVATRQLYVVRRVWLWERKSLFSSESCTSVAYMYNIKLVSLGRIFHTAYVLFLFVLPGVHPEILKAEVAVMLRKNRKIVILNLTLTSTLALTLTLILTQTQNLLQTLTII